MHEKLDNASCVVISPASSDLLGLHCSAMSSSSAEITAASMICLLTKSHPLTRYMPSCSVAFAKLGSNCSRSPDLFNIIVTWTFTLGRPLAGVLVL